jgi:hypothetical protein
MMTRTMVVVVCGVVGLVVVVVVVGYSRHVERAKVRSRTHNVFDRY